MTVLFDLDGTLCVRDQSFDALLDEAFGSAGVARYCDPADLASAAEVIDPAESDVDFHRRCLRVAAERAGVEAHADSIARAYDAALDHTAVSFRDGAADALRAAIDSERRVGLVTNGARGTQRTKLDALGIADRFETHVYADPEMGVKPDPYPFERALDGLEADPAATTYVGDSLRADVAGANALGMETVWTPVGDSTRDPDDPEPDHTLASLSELPGLL
ncbi:HAD family hydrolase [Halorarum salinum]|uniref:HAD family hydrolase n=1 Tax=Halorarum salinum TaxID=2743089 RepID=A0A7D5QHW3_9EURY|nr:HAD family hydrolase [Halobaculum salinum]QLG63243.1 HAD family hydrolase [Halobaculum salinum]